MAVDSQLVRMSGAENRLEDNSAAGVQHVGCLTRIEKFSAAHRLFSSKLSEEENRSLYGKCFNPHGHGHNYKLEVTLRGTINEVTGMIINLTDLKTIIKETVMDTLDHKNLDKEVEFFQTRPSTVENISVYIWSLLSGHPAMPRGLLWEVRLHETDNQYFTYCGPRSH